ncbi:MAG TPA: DoxX family protein [Gemmatimonadales bacterium]|nr:DoxX family protein [Gemmatimonadales bacterium]
MKQYGIVPAAWAPYLLSALRIVAAFGYMSHGTMKLFAFPSSGPDAHPVALLSLFGAGGIIETFGGGLILLGLCTRPVAWLCAGEMAVAYFLFHAPNGFWPVLNHGEIVVAYCFLFLYLAAAGPGPISLDAKLGKSA